MPLLPIQHEKTQASMCSSWIYDQEIESEALDTTLLVLLHLGGEGRREWVKEIVLFNYETGLH